MNYVMFNCKVACEIGMAGAVLLENIAFWVKKNKANKTNFHNGYYWTYNSYDAFEEQFPFMNARKIKYELHKLEYAGYVKTGEFNRNKFDRTKWYTITPEGWALLSRVEETNLSALEETKSSARTNSEAVPYNIKTDINLADNNTDKEPSGSTPSKHKEKTEVPYSDSKEFQDAYAGFLEMRKAKKAKMTERAKQMLFHKLEKIAPGNPKVQAEILDQSTMHSWTDVYPLKPTDTGGRAWRKRDEPKKLQVEREQEQIDWSQFDG